MAFALVFAAVMGAVVGSFLNVVAWRLPRGESLSHPPSRCPLCETPIKPYDNVPVLGWIWLRGKCRACKAPISPRYPIIEALTAALYAAVVAARWDDGPQIALGIALVTLLVPMTLIDLEHRLIPNKLTLPFAVTALVIIMGFDSGFLVEALVAGAAAGGFFLVAALAKPGGMGMGDVKLAAVLGLYLGRAVAPAIFAALIAGVLVGGFVMARLGRAEGRKTAIPFGPFLALGALVGLFAGDDIVDSYRDRF